MQHQLDTAINYHIRQHEINRQHADHYIHALQHAQWSQPQNQYHHQQLQMAHQHHQNEAAGHLRQVHELDRQRHQQYQMQRQQQAPHTVSVHQIVRVDNSQPRHFNGAHSDPNTLIKQQQQRIAELESEISRLGGEIKNLEMIIRNQHKYFQHLNALIQNDKTGAETTHEARSIEDAIRTSEQLAIQMIEDISVMREQIQGLKDENNLLLSSQLTI